MSKRSTLMLSCSIRGRRVIFNQDSASKVIFESACRMDVLEFGKYGRYQRDTFDRRQVFVNRLFHFMRQRFFGAFTKRYLSHELNKLMTSGGPDCVRQRLDDIIETDSHPQWMKWREQLVDLKDVLGQARELALQIDEMSLTNVQRGKLLGVFAAGLQTNTNMAKTPSPWTYNVDPRDAVNCSGRPFSPTAKMLLYAVGWEADSQIPPGAVEEVCCGWRAPGTDSQSDGPFGWGPIADNILSQVELNASPSLQEACLLAASNMKPSKWNDVVRPGLTRAARALGFKNSVTMDWTEVEQSLLRQMSWVPLSEWTTPPSKKYKTGNSVVMTEVTPSLERYVRTRARIAPMFVHDNDGCAIGLDDDPEKSKLHVSIILDAARLSRWAHGAGDDKDNFYETVIGIKVHAVPSEQTKVSSILPSIVLTGNDGETEVVDAALHTPKVSDRVDPGEKSYSGKSFFDQYCKLCKDGLYLYPCEPGASEKYICCPIDKSEDWLKSHAWECDTDGRWRLHIPVKHLKWLADGAGAVKQSSHVGHSHQCDLSCFCSIRRDVRQQLRTSGIHRLRFGAFVGVSASKQNELFKSCKTKSDRDIIAALTGIKGTHKWHCAEVNGDGGEWSDGLWHCFTTGAKKLVALLMELMRKYKLADAWQDHAHTCCRKTGGNWGYVTHGTGLIQLCGCNGGKIRDLCCLGADKLFRCSCPDCVTAVRKAGGHVKDGVAEFLPKTQFEQVTDCVNSICRVM